MRRLLESNSGTIKKSAIIVALLLAVVGLFEFFPAVNHARATFPVDWHKGQSCYDVLTARPWYGQVNPWFWFWMIFTPAVTFSVKPNAPAWQRAFRTVLIIVASYVVINLSAPLITEIRNAPFQTSEITSTSNDIERFKFGCIDTADAYVFALLFGWIPASVYAGWWEIVWYQYHKKKTKLIGKEFKTDWVNKIVVVTSITVSILVMVWVVWRAIAA